MIDISNDKLIQGLIFITRVDISKDRLIQGLIFLTTGRYAD